ncbi:hypothetical protein B0J11DRAFT_610222 [Dendryphion nanum]|uniref:F-box domain-containing protein n=1 Tax=Dendryphion nanum TaxID=256645 RepID=A0A9P9EKF5_9PLEO|nr:hypothetical protein B0J11DRAFT_610222 [Dendryphion nanum]
MGSSHNKVRPEVYQAKSDENSMQEQDEWLCATIASRSDPAGVRVMVRGDEIRPQSNVSFNNQQEDWHYVTIKDQHNPDGRLVEVRGNQIRQRKCSVDSKVHYSPLRQIDYKGGPDSRPTQASRLLTLPNELVELIVEFVNTRQDISRLSRSCRALRAIALPFLFGNISIDASRRCCLSLMRTISELGNYQRFAPMVRTFELCASENGSDTLVLGLIQTAPRLTRINIHYKIDQHNHNRCRITQIVAEDLSAALINVKDTLVHLRITYDRRCDNDEFSFDVTTGHCSLQPLHRLRDADIPFFVLFGPWQEIAPTLADLLPCNLRTLRFGDDDWCDDRISWDGDSMMEKILDYLGDKAWKWKTPHLKKVIYSLNTFDDINIDYDQAGWTEVGGEQKLRQLCSENGVQCEVIRSQFFYKMLNQE